jgi:hypothetical protein
MGFLRRLFGEDKKDPQGDTQGIYFYVQCDHCGSRVRIRADKQYDLNRTDQGFVWHKTIVDSKCFRQIPTVVHLNHNYEVVSAEIEGGRYITREVYEAPETAQEVTGEPREETEPKSAGDTEAS